MSLVRPPLVGPQRSPVRSDRSADGEDEEEVVHMGNAIMSFYSALIDLLGRCAPEMHVSNVILATTRPSQVTHRTATIGRRRQ